jgi:hypothetical protein
MLPVAFESFLRTTDPAVEKTVGKPSAAGSARKASDSSGFAVQRTEAQSQSKDFDKARVHALRGVPELAGDSSREKGETRKLKVSSGFYSPFDS